jgi:glycosyltransferase involved in cell wall biosynthesis
MAPDQSARVVSIIIPVWNEIDGLPELFDRMHSSLKDAPCAFEYVFVDNCSDDGSDEYIRNCADENPNIVLLRFSRNFGPTVEASIAAGLQYCTGDAAVVLYSDLQDPPEVIPRMIIKWLDGFDVVYATHEERVGEPTWRRIAARAFYAVAHWASGDLIRRDSGDFQLIDRKVIDVIATMSERVRFFRGLVPWTGFTSAPVFYDRTARSSGIAAGRVFAITQTAINGITSFSTVPLRILSLVGLIALMTSVLLGTASIALFLTSTHVPGLTSITVLLIANFGMIGLACGVLGEYVGRIYIEVKQRPLFVIDHSTSRIRGNGTSNRGDYTPRNFHP